MIFPKAGDRGALKPIAAAMILNRKVGGAGPMARAEMKSFRLARPRCPECYSGRTRIHWSAISNLWRVPAVVISGVLVYPVVGLRMRCRECGSRFLASRDGLEATNWEPIT